MSVRNKPEAEPHWLVRPATIRWLWIGGIALLAAFVVAGGLVHGHIVFGVEGTFGFNAWYGFVTCAAMVVVAKALGVVLKRKDTYYDH